MCGTTDTASDAVRRTVDEVVDVLVETAPRIRAGLDDRARSADGTNPSGETPLAADVRADGLLFERLSDVEAVGAYASEERDSIVDCGGGLSVAVDPLDGSSNLACNNPMGTILGVYDDDLPAPGRSLVAAAFVLYGPMTTLTVAGNGTVSEYVIDDGDRRPRTADLGLPDDPAVYGFGGRRPDWTDEFESYAAAIESELKLRYGGAMVADVNQILTYGGVFSYPGLQSRPEGKLRLQFEANPIAYVVETAGGRSSDGSKSLLDVEPTELHQRVPVHVGNDGLIERLESALA